MTRFDELIGVAAQLWDWIGLFPDYLKNEPLPDRLKPFRSEIMVLNRIYNEAEFQNPVSRARADALVTIGIQSILRDYFAGEIG